MSTLIPKGFNRIACSELIAGKAEAFWNAHRKLLMVKITTGHDSQERLIGPFDNSQELEVLFHVLSDVKSMKGNYGAC